MASCLNLSSRLTVPHLRCWLCASLLLSLALTAARPVWEGPTPVSLVYRVAIDSEYEPYEFVDDAGRPQGFTPAVLNAIGQAAGVQFEFLPMAWPDALAALDDGRVDLVNMIVTPARALRYEFSQPHSRVVQALFRHSAAADITGLNTLTGKEVSLQVGDMAFEMLADRTDFNRHLVQSKLEGLLELNTGQVQAFLCAQQAGVRLASAYQLTNVELAAGDLFPQDYAFAARKDNTRLIHLLDDHLARLQASGELETLTALWLTGQLRQPGWLERNQTLVFTVGLALLAGLVAVFLWGYTLRRQVRRQTQAIRASEAALRASETLFRQIAENVHEVFMVYSADLTQMYYINPAFETVWGLPVQRVYEDISVLAQHLHPDDQAAFQALMVNGPRAERLEFAYRIVRPTGEVRWIETRVYPLFTDDGQLTRWVGSSNDVTERHWSELRRQVRGQIAAALSEPAGREAVLQHILEALCQIEGVDSGGVYVWEEATGDLILAAHRGLSPVFINRATRFSAETPQARLAHAGQPVYRPYPQLLSGMPPDTSMENREGLRALAVIPIRWQGREVAVLNTASRVHADFPPQTREILEAAAQQIGEVVAWVEAEAALRQSRSNLQTLFDSVDEFIFILNEQGGLVHVNPVVEKRLGYALDEMRRMKAVDLHPLDRQEEAARILAAMVAGETDVCHVPLITKSGALIPVDTRVTRGQWNGQRVLFGLSRDVTERVRAEEALRASDEQLRRITNQMMDMVSQVDGQGVFRYVSPSHQAVLGYTPPELVGQPFLPFVHPDDLPAVFAARQQMREGNALPLTLFRMRHTAGHYVWLEASVSPLLDEHGQMNGAVFGGRDVTERLRAAEALRASEERFRTFIEQSSEGMVLTDEQGRVIEWNHAQEAITGIPSAQALGASMWEIQGRNVVPEQREIFTLEFLRQSLESALLTRQSPFFDQSMEAEIQSLTGERRVVLQTLFPVATAQGFHLGAIVRDITERKHIEDALRASEERFRHIAENMPILLDAFSADDRLLMWNRECERVTGYTAAEMVDNPRALEVLYPDPDYRARQMADWAQQEGDYHNVEWELTCKDGQKRTIAWSSISHSVPIPGWSTWGVGVDITERKRAEAALRESEAKYRAMFEVSPDIIYLTDSAGNLLEANAALLKQTGLTLEQLRQLNVQTFFAGEDPRQLDELLTQMLAGQSVVGAEIQARGSGPGAVTYEINAVPLWTAGQVTHVLSLARDITARKQIETQLRASEARNHAILDAIPDLMFLQTYPDGVFLDYHAPELSSLIAPPEQLLGQRMDALLPPHLAARLSETFRQAVTTGRPQMCEYEIDTPRGRLMEEARVVAIGHQHVLSLVRDITARKHMETQLRASLREKDVLVKEVHHRVKNNLQVMISLLNLQADRISDPAALAVFHDSRERVRTMALVHEKLYQSPDLAHIHFGDYLSDLTHSLQMIYDVRGNVRVEVNAEAIWLGVDTAIPCGLLANELISNAFKYAFPAGRAGMVRVDLRVRSTFAEGARQLCLAVSDDGVGLPPGLDPAQTESLGLQLAHILTKQLNGALTVSGPPGVTFEITFQERKGDQS